MKQTITGIFASFLLPAAAAYAQDNGASMKRGNITVVLTGFKNYSGTVKLSLCRSEDELQNTMRGFCTASAGIKNKHAELVFKNIPYGRYCIKAFHDENGNSRLDTNFAGMPVELYGFSNNARGRFGPPLLSVLLSRSMPRR
ncbi:MAG: DUF2141 domain-containing protein [Proteobacteria bacterium]|nr:DUF2141 domain-containing protein [Pseudomonadota bacterium]